MKKCRNTTIKEDYSIGIIVDDKNGLSVYGSKEACFVVAKLFNKIKNLKRKIKQMTKES